MITAEARAAARSAYRAIFRATAVTFKGDERLLQAFRSQTRQAYVANRPLTDPVAYNAAVTHAAEVAEVLLKNVAQAIPTDKGTWQLRLTKDTEMGDNESIKTHKASGRPAGASLAQRSFSTSTSVRIPRSKRVAHAARQIPELKEEDIEEAFVRGSGAGGQKINKTSSAVSLIHKPTGIRVLAQPTRSREQNRKLARRILLDKLDQHLNPGVSRVDMQWEKKRQQKRNKAKAHRKKESDDDGSGALVDAERNGDEAAQNNSQAEDADNSTTSQLRKNTADG